MKKRYLCGYSLSPEDILATYIPPSFIQSAVHDRLFDQKGKSKKIPVCSFYRTLEGATENAKKLNHQNSQYYPIFLVSCKNDCFDDPFYINGQDVIVHRLVGFSKKNHRFFSAATRRNGQRAPTLYYPASYSSLCYDSMNNTKEEEQLNKIKTDLAELFHDYAHPKMMRNSTATIALLITGHWIRNHTQKAISMMEKIEKAPHPGEIHRILREERDKLKEHSYGSYRKRIDFAIAHLTEVTQRNTFTQDPLESLNAPAFPFF